MSALLPIPQNFPLVDQNGNYTREFKRYLDGLLGRVGGVFGGSYGILTDEASITWDVEQTPVAEVTLSDNRTLTQAINHVAGNYTPYRLTVIQDAIGGRTLTLGAGFLTPGGGGLALTAAPFAVDDFQFVSDGTYMKLIVSALNQS